MHAPPKRSGWLAGPLVAAATYSLVRLAGCDNNPMATDDMTTGMDMAMQQSPGPPTTSTSVASVDRPLAAVLSPDGSTIYLTAHDANGRAQLYTLPAAGGTPALIATSAPLIHPLSMAISPDGASLYIVDSAGGAEDAGAVYKSTTSGSLGSPAFTGVRGPAGVAVSADGNTVYVTGFDATDGQPGVFFAGSGGGNLAVTAKGAPFSSPSAVAFAGDGTLYVVDATSQGSRQGAVIKVAGTAATVFAKLAGVGFSAGISPNGVGSSDLLVTSNNGLGNGAIWQVTTSGTASGLPLSTMFFDPATIHRAANVSKWVAVDSVNATQTNPAQQLGQVYVLTP